MRLAKYLGNGSEFLNNIPARDLSADEYNALTDEQRELLKASKLYDVQHAAPAAKSAVKSAAPAVAESAPAVKDEGKK